MKPYRLINNNELHYFQHRFNEKLEAWNNLYAANKIKFSIESCKNFFPHCTSLDEDFLLLKKDEKPIALLPVNYLLIIKQSLFSETSDCFNPVAKDFFFAAFKPIGSH